uniref:NAD kinase n=1 Tax=Sphingomonas sp. A1 TaxID=90322 RepID=Q6L7J5_9SPHN|nr:ATP-NAD kinase [Sphingomonas sp. A1]
MNVETATVFKTVALLGKYQSSEAAEALGRLEAYLAAQGMTVWIEADTAKAVGTIGSATAVSFEQIGEEADLAIVVGGDGTLLSAARRLAVYNVPLVGINQGRLGFLTDIGRDEMIQRVGEILAGQYLRERRMLLDAEVLRGGQHVFHTVALNDVVLSRGESGRMIEFDLHVDGEYIYSQRSDGMIVATPTGSTAYALSANGPLLHPRLAGIVLVPLLPHGLTYRPLALAQESVVELVISPGYDARIHFDGQTLFEAHPLDRIRLRRSALHVTLLHPEGYSYFAVLREKLHWSAAPRLS